MCKRRNIETTIIWFIDVTEDGGDKYMKKQGLVGVNACVCAYACVCVRVCVYACMCAWTEVWRCENSLSESA